VIRLQGKSTYQRASTWKSRFLSRWAVPEEDKQPIGVWGRRHLQHVRECHRGIYVGLQLSGKLGRYLDDINQQAEEMFDWSIRWKNKRG